MGREAAFVNLGASTNRQQDTSLELNVGCVVLLDVLGAHDMYPLLVGWHVVKTMWDKHDTESPQKDLHAEQKGASSRQKGPSS